MLKADILQRLGDEVELIFSYGSMLNGTAHAYSDIDISYVPTRESTWDSTTVLVDDVMIDLYPIHWSKLEQMATFDDPSGGVLLNNNVVYAQTPEIRDRFVRLSDTFTSYERPEARSIMVSKALRILQGVMYQFYLLKQQAELGHSLSCMFHAQQVMKSLLHCIMVVNQKHIDTRKREQVLALSKLPNGIEDHIDILTGTTEPETLLSACDELLKSTRNLLLAEQSAGMQTDVSLPDILESAYPELKGDIQHILLACERKDTFNFTLMSLYHELMIHMSQAINRIKYSEFNTIPEYSQDLLALGFPDLLPAVKARDFAALRTKTLEFDACLQNYLTENKVPLNSFASLDELAEHLTKQ